MQSALAPTSSKTVIPPSSLGISVESGGLNIPEIDLIEYKPPTYMAPVFPAEANPSIFPFAIYSNPFAILELGFDLNAFVGFSSIFIISEQSIISNSLDSKL